jgi:hypothetical protein
MASEPHDDTTTVRLHTGEAIALAPAEVERVYDQLWLLAPRKGAITAASKLKRVDAWALLHGDDVLNAEETEALREALRRVFP